MKAKTRVREAKNHTQGRHERVSPSAGERGLDGDEQGERSTWVASAVEGHSVEAQAAWLGNPALQSAQRQAAATQVCRTQGNQHVQRVMDAVQTAPQAKGPVKVRDLKNALYNIFSREWLNQSNGSKPIQLTSTVIAVLRMVTNLSAADIARLWRTPPKYPRALVSRISHALPDTVPQSTMAKLEEMGLKLSTQIPKAAPKQVPTLKGGPTVLEREEQEKLFKALVHLLQGKGPEEKSQATEAIKKLFEGYLETGQGKKVKQRVLQWLISKKGIPILVLAGGGALAGMIAKNTDIPATPEIPLSDNVSLKFEFEGTFQAPKGFKVSLKWAFGGPKKVQTARGKRTVLALPKELHAYIDRIDRDMLIKWFRQRAFYEWESAGPEWEQDALKFYQAARDRPHALGLPDTRLVAVQISRDLVATAIQNRVSQLEGKSMQKTIRVDLGRTERSEHTKQWDRLHRIDGLEQRMQWLLKLLVPKVPFQALGIEQVTFLCGKKWQVTVPVKR